MSDSRRRWEDYKRALDKRAVDHPIQWVIATIVFSFVAGMNTNYVMFASQFRPHFGTAVTIYVLTTSYICVAMFGATLVRVLRQQPNLVDLQQNIKDSGDSH